MDFTGLALGALTIPMVLLSAGAGIAGFWLIIHGDWPKLLTGIVALGVGAVLAPILPKTGGGLADVARSATMGGRRALGYFAGFVHSALPVAIIIIWEVTSFHLLQQRDTQEGGIADWLWSYGVATGVWSWRAHRAEGQDRTSSGIQAYSAHLAYMIFSAGMIFLGWPMPLAIAVMLLPMLLPLTVSTLLAIADRDALRDVQI
ncbi:hypothetical protein CLG96_09805 [Sphingomonas oleivorans]|uniref:Uncharacterized protein n=1 Tax=Sphingomonas oleivorans TaxID=1735121 RepID=A0A2T5FX48_9SPHN|nr:hypothetical protein [Sphingomonas oleivorans]PTQ10701.1 hypothetical protein CLG96_09805 [Sphingomonas oleivorans]